MQKTKFPKEVILTKVIYVASPYTYKSKNEPLKCAVQETRYHAVTSLIGVLQDKYEYAFIGPITQSHNTVRHMKNTDTTFFNWMTRDLTYISRCDELWVYKLNGWNKSVGVLAEISFAKSIGIPVRYIDKKTLKVGKK